MILPSVASLLFRLRSGSLFTHQLRRFACGACLLSVTDAAHAGSRADLSLGAVASAPTSTAVQGEAMAHYATALQLEAEGRIRSALQHYKEAVKHDPANPELAARTAELLINYESRDAAITLLQACIKAAPQDSGAYINLARFFATYPGDDPFAPDQAGKVLTEALSKFPHSAELYRETVIMHLTRNLREEAASAMALAAKQSVNDPTYWLETGRIAQQVWPLSHPEKKAEHREKVNPFFEKALKLSPISREDVRLAVAQYYLLSNQLERAAEVTEEAARLNKSMEARKLLVRLYQTLDREPDAIKLLEELLKETPTDVENRRLLVNLYERNDDFERAVPHAEALIQAAGGTAEDYMSLGILLLRSGQSDKAQQLSQRTLALFPSNPRFTFQAALAQRSLKRYDDALKLYEKTEALAQGTAPEILNDSFYQSWGDALQAAERYDEAAKKYQRSIDLTPESDPARAAVVLNNLGYMWLEQNKNLDACGKFIAKANELDPQNPIYMDSLGWWHFVKGDYQAALKVFLDVEKLLAKPGNGDAEIFDHIARTYLKLGDRAKALSYFDQALKLDPGNSQIKQRKEQAAQP